MLYELSELLEVVHSSLFWFVVHQYETWWQNKKCEQHIQFVEIGGVFKFTYMTMQGTAFC